MGLIALGLIKPETGPNTLKKNLTEPFATMIGNFFFHRLMGLLFLGCIQTTTQLVYPQRVGILKNHIMPLSFNLCG